MGGSGGSGVCLRSVLTRPEAVARGRKLSDSGSSNSPLSPATGDVEEKIHVEWM